ncbi:dienelactone hydrolase family protein [Acetobacteraceae bacterium KSS8]|uniref:Dienelactone hydrolase family protein n=1 Tax=Endosaccharibacter trunci TaxID=2812733 RepID=A0ABT1W603_9PROT|nr:dienelactone hydrolase family protein [Acetobacteraceae bacterium KSS8]
MGNATILTASDGHRFEAYRTGLPDAPRALIVVQEIFGVNHHIRSVADGFGDSGFAVIAPAIFDRVRSGVELGYDEAGMKTGIELMQQIPLEQTLADLIACADALGHAKVGIVGYCWGGSLAWAAATRTQRFAASVGWYGGAIAQTADASPNCPVQLHFGADDDHIPLSDVDKIRAPHPDMEIYVYEGAGHGFGCSERGSYEARSAALAQERTLSFLQHTL